MRFSTVFSVLASGTMALAAAIAPAALVARGGEQGLAIVEQFKLDVETCVSKIGGCDAYDSNCHKEIVIEIQTAIETACDGFGGIEGEIDVDISGTIGEVYLSVVEELQVYTSGCDEDFAVEVINIYIELDTKFCNFLEVIQIHIVAIIVLVGKILKPSYAIFEYFKFEALISLCL